MNTTAGTANQNTELVAITRWEGGLRIKGPIKDSLPDQPLITVITATYNAAEHLHRVIHSIRNQTYKNIEWLIVDGASKDATIDMLKLNEDVIDYWVSEPDSGIYDAWNKGLSLARGEWIAFLGCDDTYYPDAIEQYVRYIQANSDKQFDYVSSQVEFINAREEVIQILGRAWSWPKFLKKMVVAHVGSLHHRSMYERYGLYDTTYKTAADYELLLRAGDALQAGFLDVITARMQFGGASNDMLSALAEAKRAKHETGGRPIIFCYFDNVIDMTKIVLIKTINRKYRC